jgi:hypothetical protein
MPPSPRLTLTNTTTLGRYRDKEVQWIPQGDVETCVEDKLKELEDTGFFERSRPITSKRGLHVATIRTVGTDLGSRCMLIRVVKYPDGSFKCRAKLDGEALRKYLAEKGGIV